MKQPKLRHLPLAAAALVACSGAMAGYTSPDGSFSLSGFGTVGLSGMSNDEVLFVYPGQGGGSNQSPSLNPDTKAAVQGTYKFAPTVSATAQIMSKYNALGQYTPDIEWAFAKWQALPSVTLRAGRMGAPFFMVSDFRDVGYANNAVRPNLDVYGQVPFSSFNGADVAYQTSLGGTTLTSTLWAGALKNKYQSALRSSGAPSEAVTLDLKNSMGLNIVAETEFGFTFRVGHSQGKLTSTSAAAKQVSQAAQAVAAYNSGSAAAAAEVVAAMTVNDTDASFSGLGLTYDQDNLVVAAEYTKRKIGSGYIADSKGWYLTTGYRFGNVMPYVSVSRLSSTPNETISGASYLNLGTVALTYTGPDVPTTTAVRTYAGAAVYGSQAVMNTQKQTEHTLSVGARWDVSSGLALKAQWDHVNVPSGSNGLFLMADPVQAAKPTAAGGTNNAFLNKRKDINVLSVSVDFVF